MQFGLFMIIAHSPMATSATSTRSSSPTSSGFVRPGSVNT